MSEDSSQKQPLGQGTMTKKRYHEIIEYIQDQYGEEVANTVGEKIKQSLNFDPNVTTYSSERGRQIVDNRRKRAELLGVSTYVLNGKAHYERMRKAQHT